MSDPTPAGHDPGASVHRPVLVREVLQLLDLRPELVVVDGTVGGGGHSQVILEQLGADGRLIGLDRDPTMLVRASRVLADTRVTLKPASYAELPTILDSLGITQVDRLLLDLGLSSDQLADPLRGFGIQSGLQHGQSHGPSHESSGGAALDMRFDPSAGPTASELLATLDENELAELLERFGEERASRAIARAIVARRANIAHWTATDLVAAVAAAQPRGPKRHHAGPVTTHPATRVFQALRIAVNHELEHLQDFLATALPRPVEAGRLRGDRQFPFPRRSIGQRRFSGPSTMAKPYPQTGHGSVGGTEDESALAHREAAGSDAEDGHEADWDVPASPDNSTLSRILGLVLVVVLAGVFSFVAYRKYQEAKHNPSALYSRRDRPRHRRRCGREACRREQLAV